MLCDKCNKNEAQFCIIETKNGEKSERYLCSNCAFNKNASDDDFFQGFINNIISKVVNYYYEQLSDTNNNVDLNSNNKEDKCDVCGLTLSEITKLGKVGCSHCYVTFNEALNQIILKLQGSNQHLGKVIQKFEKEIYTVREIGLLRDTLKEKIKKEEYEEAAILRDKIKELEEVVSKR